MTTRGDVLDGSRHTAATLSARLTILRSFSIVSFGQPAQRNTSRHTGPGSDAEARTAKDHLAISHARSSLGFTPADTVLVRVGPLLPGPELQFLIDHHPQGPGRVQLLLVGESPDPRGLARLRAAIARAPGARRIHLAGTLADPSLAYRAADLLVSAAVNAEDDDVLRNALTHGLRIVSRRRVTTEHGLVELARPGGSFETPAQYAAAVCRLAGKPLHS